MSDRPDVLASFRSLAGFRMVAVICRLLKATDDRPILSSISECLYTADLNCIASAFDFLRRCWLPNKERLCELVGVVPLRKEVRCFIFGKTAGEAFVKSDARVEVAGYVAGVTGICLSHRPIIPRMINVL
jgi:hypothetical protein